MEIYKDLSNPASQEFEKLLNTQLSKIQIEEGKIIDGRINKVTEKLKSIALKFNSNLSSEKPIMDEITRISVLTLAEHLNNHGHNIPEEKCDVERLINDSSEQIIKRLEDELNIKNKSEESLMSRIRTIRSRIHASRIDKPDTTLESDREKAR